MPLFGIDTRRAGLRPRNPLEQGCIGAEHQGRIIELAPFKPSPAASRIGAETADIVGGVEWRPNRGDGAPRVELPSAKHVGHTDTMRCDGAMRSE